MGRHNGSWSKHHLGIWDHPKTRAAAAEVAAAGVPGEFAPMLVVTAVLRLSAWALGNGDTGETASLSDARLCAVAWAEAIESKKFGTPARTGALLRGALRRAGFLEDVRGVEGVHDFQEHYLEVLNKRRENRDLPKWKPEMIAAAGGRIVEGNPSPGPTPTPPVKGPTKAPAKVPTEAPDKGPGLAPQKHQPDEPDAAGSPGERGGSRACDAPARASAPDRAPESDPPVAGGPDAGAATSYVPQQAPQKVLNDVRGSGSGSGSGSGRGSGAEPRLASPRPEPEPTTPADASDDAPSTPDDAPPEAPRSARLDVLAADVHRRSGAPPTFARTIVDELVDRVEGDVAFVERHLAAHPLPRGADLADWKRRVAKAWVAENDRTRLEAAQRNAELRHLEQSLEATLAAEFASSGYTDRVAWSRDRKAGQLRTGPDAARRRFHAPTLSVVDADEPATATTTRSNPGGA